MKWFKNLFRCKACAAKDDEIQYLRSMIDRLHEKIGINATVDPHKLIEDFDAEEIRREAEEQEFEEVGG